MLRKKKRAFTLIELLVVIAIIAILAAILFPVFSQARERARQIACTSNAKQFMLGILQYAQDSDEIMPISYAVNNSIGPIASQLTGNPEAGVPAQIMPYIKSHEVFHCPDDNGGMQANGDGPTNGLTWAQETGHTYAEIVGTSYKFTHQNFSNPYPVGTPGYTATGYTIPGTTGGSDVEYSTNGRALTASEISAGKMTPTSSEMAIPASQGAFGSLSLADFAQPSVTRVYADFPKNFVDKPLAAGKVAFHKIGTTIAYMDGHVKYVTRYSDYASGCDGIDWSWTTAGACNNKGIQRLKD